MTQTAETQTTETAAPETAAVARVANEKQNGVVRPSANTQTGQVWAIAEALGTKLNRAPKRAEVIEAATAANINPATASTQFGKWCKFWNIKIERAPAFGREPKPATEGEAPAAAPKAAKGKKSGKQNLTAAAGAAALGAASVETEGVDPVAPATEPTANEFLAQQAQG